MTRYHGGKQRYADAISDCILNQAENSKWEIKGYCEPFFGMGSVMSSVIEKIDGYTSDEDYTSGSESQSSSQSSSQSEREIYTPIDLNNIKFLAGDANKSLILMWKEAQKKWKNKKYITEKEFNRLKDSSSSSSSKGFYGHVYSTHGIYFSHYDKAVDKKRNNYSNEKIKEMGEVFKDVKFTPGNYTQFSNLKNYIIYCDPPYSKQNIYYDDRHRKLPFDHSKFWSWCDKMSKNNLVLISEYSAPKNYKSVLTQGKEKVFIRK